MRGLLEIGAKKPEEGVTHAGGERSGRDILRLGCAAVLSDSIKVAVEEGRHGMIKDFQPELEVESEATAIPVG